MKRVDRMKRVAFNERGFDGFAVFNWANLLYLTGSPATAALFIPKDGEPAIYVYVVNFEQAKAEGKGLRVELVKRDKNLMSRIAEKVKDYNIKRLAVDALGVEEWKALNKEIPDKTLPKVEGNLVMELRKVKDTEETALIRKAGELASRGMKAAYETLRPGMKEFEVAAEIEYTMRKHGSYGTAFDTIVASGVNSAFPHGGCCDRIIREGDLVVVDVGATYKFYRSDMTRTLVAGKPSEKQKDLYKIVKTSQEAAFKAMKPKAKAKDIDFAARKIIGDAGYGEYFVHGLGHGVGLEVHEPPTLNAYSTETLVDGNVVTDEPGIYLVGYGGVRIEDTVVVQKNGAERLTYCSHGLVAE